MTRFGEWFEARLKRTNYNLIQHLNHFKLRPLVNKNDKDDDDLPLSTATDLVD